MPDATTPVAALKDAIRRFAATDPKLREAIADELADVANIVFLLSEHTGIDLSDAIAAKMAKNEVKYPAPQ